MVNVRECENLANVHCLVHLRDFLSLIKDYII